MMYDEDASDDDDLGDTQILVASISYYLYRLAGCPYGDNPSGCQAWVQTSLVEPFKRMCDEVDGPE